MPPPRSLGPARRVDGTRCLLGAGPVPLTADHHDHSLRGGQCHRLDGPPARRARTAQANATPQARRFPQANRACRRLRAGFLALRVQVDVAEEFARLKTHLNTVQTALAGKGPVGKRLDFLMQELNREANTLSSKSVSEECTQAALELKLLIEQMREQVQNLE